jgi:nucleoid DNA-binding protein
MHGACSAITQDPHHLLNDMNYEQLVTKYSQVSGRNQAESTAAVTSFIQILTDAIKEEEDIFTPTLTMKTRRTTPKPSPDGKERKPKTVGKIVIK